jgi:CRISPR type III-B/RAMP module RAMP protein Cmr1
MWQREEEIFGSTEFPSPLVIRVVSTSALEQFDPTDNNVIDKFGPVAYALFASIENQQLVAREGIVFELLLSWPNAAELNRQRRAANEQRQASSKKRGKSKTPLLPDTIAPIDGEIRSAVSAWTIFGGVGGRTRRGCGALAVHSCDPALPAFDYSAIRARIFTGKPCSEAREAWAESLRLYREFRQSPRGARHKKTLPNGRVATVPGRTHWPEPDSIRQITGCSLKPPKGSPPTGVAADEDTNDHSKPLAPAAALPSFPKAILGLPMNFHFADGPGKGRDGLRPGAADKDPQDVQLVPLVKAGENKWRPGERMASPIITRPLLIGGKWHPAFIVLATPELESLQVGLVGQKSMAGGNPVSQNVPHQQIVHPSLGAITPMRGKASAIDALIEFLTKSSGFGELAK